MGCSLDDLRVFGINTDWENDAERQNKGRSISWKMDRCRGTQGWTTTCSGTPERDGKDKGKDIPKQAGLCWFACPC